LGIAPADETFEDERPAEPVSIAQFRARKRGNG
jgi:hypothetical protein